MPEEDTNLLTIPWVESVETLLRRRWMILAATVFGLLAGVLQVRLAAPLYKAEAKIMLTAQPGSGARQGAPDRQIRAELALLKSPAFIASVLDEYEEEESEKRPALDPEVISQRIQADTVANSNVVQLTFTDTEPAWAARFVNDILERHVERIAILNEQLNARSFFTEQRDLASRRWVEARQELTEFRERQGALLLTGDIDQLRSVLAELESEAVATETRVLQLEAKVEYLSDELGRQPETISAETRVTENESVKLLKSKILELEIRRSELLSSYTPTSTAVREIERQIEEANRLMAEKGGETLAETMTERNPSFQNMHFDLVRSRADLTEAQARGRALNIQISQYRSKLGELEKVDAELDRLENEVERAAETVASYGGMEDNARLASAMDESRLVNIVVVEKAIVPSIPEPSKPLFKILFGTLAGLLVGTGWAFLRDWLDPSVKTSAQARRLTGLPVLAEIPPH